MVKAEAPEFEASTVTRFCAMTPPTPLVYPAVMCVPDSGESGGMQSSKGEDAGPVLTET